VEVKQEEEHKTKNEAPLKRNDESGLEAEKKTNPAKGEKSEKPPSLFEEKKYQNKPQ